jgi:hypothetical protein
MGAQFGGLDEVTKAFSSAASNLLGSKPPVPTLVGNHDEL